MSGAEDISGLLSGSFNNDKSGADIEDGVVSPNLSQEMADMEWDKNSYSLSTHDLLK